MGTSEIPDLILLDMSLPVIDGWAAAGHLKENPDTKNIPVIAIIAHAMAEDKEKALAAGCDDFDTKPIYFKELRAKIDKYLGE